MPRIPLGIVSWILAILIFSWSLAFSSPAVYPALNAISDAVEQSAPFDTILVSPGFYPRELGAPCPHPISVIGVGGSAANEIRLCSEMCGGALIAFFSNAAGLSIVEGLNVTPYEGVGFVSAIYAGDSRQVIIRHCTFRGLGSGVRADGPNVTVSRNLFLGMGYGVIGGPGLISGNTFAGLGTAIELADIGPSTTVEANLFLNNHWAIRCGNNSPVILRCNDVWGNATAYTGCSDPTGQNGNIAADPLVCDASAGDFRLLPGSPCLPEHSPPGCGLIGAFGGCEVLTVPPAELAASRLSVTPNPMRHQATIAYSDQLRAPILEIYDLQGRTVEIIHAGAPPYVWKPNTDVRPGVYFIRLRAREGSATSKFVVLPR